MYYIKLWSTFLYIIILKFIENFNLSPFLDNIINLNIFKTNRKL